MYNIAIILIDYRALLMKSKNILYTYRVGGTLCYIVTHIKYLKNRYLCNNGTIKYILLPKCVLNRFGLEWIININSILILENLCETPLT